MLLQHSLVVRRHIEFLNAGPANLGMKLLDSSVATYETHHTHSTCVDLTCFDMHQISMPQHRSDQIRSYSSKYSSKNGTHDPLLHMYATHRSHEETQYRSRPQPYTYQICNLTYRHFISMFCLLAGWHTFRRDERGHFCQLAPQLSSR